MTIGRMGMGVALGLALTLAGCGGGSGRSGTDLAVSGVGPSAQLNGGDPAVFLMTLSNAGQFSADNLTIRNATVQLSQPTVTITCTASGGAVCPTSTGTTMTVPTLPAGGSLVFQVSGTTNLGASGIISDSLSVHSDTTEVDPNNNTATATGTVVSNDVSVIGTAPPGPLVDGPATFTMAVGNAGPNDAVNVVLSTSTSANVSFDPAAISCVPAATGPLAAVPTLQPDGTLRSALIPAGGGLTCSVSVIVAQATNGFAIVSMTATAVGDARTTNNTGSASVNATLINNVGVAANPAPASVPGGGTTTFTMAVSNAGPGTAVDVTLNNVLSANLTLTSPITCAASGGAVAPPAFTSSAVAPAVPSGGTLTCSVPVLVTAGTNGTVGTTFTVAAANDQFSINNTATASTLATTADLGVSQTAPSTVAAGTPTTFTAVVANPRAQGAATNLVIQWTHSAPAGSNVTFAAPTCAATGGGTCPTVLGPTMNVPSLLTGASLVFSFVANTTANDRGAIVNTVSVSADGDPDNSNNSASTTSTVVDPRNATYNAFAADGNAYSFAVDFDAGQYTMTGGAGAVTRTFTRDSSSGDYVAGGNVRFRYASTGDLIVGGHNFSSGVLPYVAARSFVASVAQIAGSYDLATRNVPTAGAPSTHAGTALINGNTLSVCQSDVAQVTTVAACDAAALKSYSLSLNGSVFTGISSSGESYSFVVASSGAAKFLLSAGLAPDNSQQLRVGLVDSSGGLTYGAVRGPSTGADWLAITLAGGTPPTYAAASAIGSGSSDAANLARPNPSAGPFSMLTGTSTTYNAPIYVMQASPLVIVIGSGGFGGAAANGLFEIAVP